jgi:hypothetical protein
MLIHAMPHPVIDCCCPFSYYPDLNAKVTVTAMLKLCKLQDDDEWNRGFVMCITFYCFEAVVVHSSCVIHGFPVNFATLCLLSRGRVEGGSWRAI